jgi:uncharacterized protein (DUF433 family)
MDENGVLRVGTSRIPLEHVLYLHGRGENPAEIQEAFPTLDMADIHGAISYYLKNRAVVDEYLEATRREEDSVRRTIEKSRASEELRTRIRSRREAR